MPDFSDPTTLGEGAAIAAIAWAYLFLFCPALARKAGVAYQEPPVALYGPKFNAIRIVALIAMVAMGIFFAPPYDIFPLLPAVLLNTLISILLTAFLLLILAGVMSIALRIRDKIGEVDEDEDDEDEPAPKPTLGALGEEIVVADASFRDGLIKIVLLTLGMAALVSAIPYILSSAVSAPGLDHFLGTADGDYKGHLATSITLYFTYVFFSVVPGSVAIYLDEEDVNTVWARSSGLVFFRWIWMGLILAISLGLHETIPVVGGLFPTPLQQLDGVIMILLGAAIFAAFWIWPMKYCFDQSKVDSRYSNDVLARVRFGGLGTLVVVKFRNKGTVALPVRPSSEPQVCEACLRQTDDITDYEDFDFEHCPHCRSKITPVYSLMDYVTNQATRLDPMFEGSTGGSGPLKERRVVQDIVRALLAVAVRDRGTDLHIAPEQDNLAIRVRTDGVLYTLLEFDKSLARPLISAVKVMANLDITERRKPQDGAFSVDFQDRHVDVRVNTSPVANGEMAALRLLYVQDVLGSIEKLGITPRYIPVMQASINSPQGLILATGPTGSGKSTTLYNSLDTIANGTRNIITLEDPIEYRIGGLTQMQVEPSKGFTFSTGLRSILRQDPDVIMVGEIRDSETAKMAVDAAATGHLVFSTLHANDAVGVVGRLIDLEIDPRRVAEVTQLFLAQRLIRVICKVCKEPIKITSQDLEAKGFPQPPGMEFDGAVGKGCENCHESGYRGRIGIYEFFKPEEDLKLMIAEGTKHPLIRRRARELGMRNIVEDGLTKVFLGITTLDELQRVAG